MSQTKELLETLLARLESLANSRTIIGNPTEVKGTTIVPLVEISLGVSAGSFNGDGEGNGTDEKGRQGAGKGHADASAGGGGIKLTPLAILCVSESGCAAFAVGEKKGVLNRLADLLPQMLERAGEQRSRQKEENR